MILNPSQQQSEVLTALQFPRKGDKLETVEVLDAKAQFEQDTILKYQVTFPKGTKEKQVPVLLKQFFNTQLIDTNQNLVVRYHDYTVKPVGEKVVVSGAMHILPIAFANPGALEFDQDYSKMVMDKPETYFRKFDYSGFNGPQFRAKLFSLVSTMGENYGYCDDNCIYHRRASLIMPKIKITKAVKDAKMMYHTHPKKDEPSLSSADDYLLYFDLSHEPRSIRHFYTVMADRMDYFHITPKKDSKTDFLKLSEDKFIDEVNAKMDELEVKWSEKIPKENSSKEDDLRFCEGITSDLVKWLNSKYSKFFTIKYKCYYKVRQNPPKKETKDIHLNDEFLKRGLVEISSGNYEWPEFKSETQPHEYYAYWHQRYYTEHVRDSFMRLGVDLQGADARRRDQYMNKRFENSMLSRIDALHILNYSYDISIADSQIRDGKTFQSRLEELCEYLELDEETTEALKHIENIILSSDVFDEQAETMSGDYYPLVLLSNYSIQAVEIMKRVNNGEMNLEVAKFEIYNRLKQTTASRLISFLSRVERLPANGFIDARVNPAVYFKKLEAYTQFPPEAFELTEILRSAFSEFDPQKFDIGKNMMGQKQVVLYVPTEQGRVTVMIYRSTGTAQMHGPSLEACADAAQQINTQLYKFGARGISIDEEFTISTELYAKNPQTAQVITISGPSGSGKSTTIRNLLTMLPNAKTAPTVTTRKKRKSDKEGERIYVTKEEFQRMLANGELVAAQLQKSGNYYGRKRSDFENADYIIVDVSLSGVNDIRKAYPNTFTVFLEPVEDPEIIRQRLIRRGDMSAEEARGRASIIPKQIADSKKMSFDARVKTQEGYFDAASKQVFDLLPKKNPHSVSGSMDEVHMLMHYTVEELENENDLPTIQQCADSVTRENFVGGGAFGKVFRIPGTDYLFKINQIHDPKLFNELNRYLNKNADTFVYPTEGVTRYRVDYRIPFEAGQPRAWLRKEGTGKHADIIMKNIEGFTIADKIPQAVLTKEDRKKGKKANLYPSEKIEEYYEWVKEISEIPQKNLNEIVRRFAYLQSRGIPMDVHSGNAIYNEAEKMYTITDWFWDEKETSKAIFSSTPTLSRIFERISLVSWMFKMQEYFSVNKQFKRSAAIQSDKFDEGKRHALKYLEKCIVAFEQNKLTAGKYDWQASYFYDQKKEKETYIDMMRRILTSSTLLEWPDFEFVTRPEIEPLANPNKPKYIRIEESTNKEKKLVAYFFDENKKKIRTVHFGARGMSDYTQHKDKERWKRYLGRHKNMGEDWNDPMTAGALSRWILWGKPSLRESFNDFKKKFKLEGTMAVTNTRMNPRTSSGKKFPTKYLTGLNAIEKEIAKREIEKGYEYDLDDPKAYEYWKSDIKATARGYKTVPSKYKKQFVKLYGPLPEKGDFITKISKATGVKKSILQKVYDKGLAAWRVGHRPAVQQHQWAAGRVYSFVTLGNTVMKDGKPMSDHSLAVKAGLIKENPSEADFFPGDANVALPYMISPTIPIHALQNPNEWRHGEFAEEDPFEEYF